MNHRSQNSYHQNNNFSHQNSIITSVETQVLSFVTCTFMRLQRHSPERSSGHSVRTTYRMNFSPGGPISTILLIRLSPSFNGGQVTSLFPNPLLLLRLKMGSGKRVCESVKKSQKKKEGGKEKVIFKTGQKHYKS